MNFFMKGKEMLKRFSTEIWAYMSSKSSIGSIKTTTFGLIIGARNFEILVFEGYRIRQWPHLYPERKVGICVRGFVMCFGSR